MSRKIVFTSGKGGVGKTTCCACVGAELAKLGARVVMLDVDIGLNNLDIVAGIDDKVIYDIVDIVEGKCRIRQALVKHNSIPNLYFLPSVHTYNIGKIDAFSIKDIVNQLSNIFDYILIDCPAGIGVEFYRAIYLASEVIIVTTPNISAIRDANKVISLILGCGISNMSLLVNRVRTDLLSRHSLITPEDISKSLDISLLGQVKESDEITILSCVNGDINNIKSNVLDSFKILANKIHYGESKDKILNHKNKLNFKRI